MRTKFNTENKNIYLFGKEISNGTFTIIIILYLFFLAIIWPIISQSYLFIPFIVCFLPLIFPQFISDDIIKNAAILKTLLFTGLTLTTFIYVYFILEGSFIVKLMHCILYYTFGYIYSKKFDS